MLSNTATSASARTWPSRLRRWPGREDGDRGVGGRDGEPFVLRPHEGEDEDGAPRRQTACRGIGAGCAHAGDVRDGQVVAYVDDREVLQSDRAGLEGACERPAVPVNDAVPGEH